MTHENAPESTHSPEQGSRALPDAGDATDAGEALVQQIAEVASCEHHWVSTHQPDFPSAVYWIRQCSQCHRFDGADLTSLVEAQVAPLRDEVERLRSELEEVERQRDNWRTCYQQEQEGREDVERAHDAAESALRQVREDLTALADEWEKFGRRPPEFMWARLLAILDSARVGAADTQPDLERGADAPSDVAPELEVKPPRALGVCGRCGNVVGLMHTQPECDAMYARKYREASISVSSVPPLAADTQPAGVDDDWAERVANIWRDSPKTRAALTERYSGLAWALDHLAYPEDTPTAGGKVDTAPEAHPEDVECCASGSCEVCQPHRYPDLLRNSREEQRRLDNEPCPKCGGDRLRPNFTAFGCGISGADSFRVAGVGGCTLTDESTWLSAASCGYGSGYEPGSQWEYDPDCPEHGIRFWCVECEARVPVDEVFDAEIGFEEQARPVIVTRLDCGHEIVRAPESGEGR